MVLVSSQTRALSTCISVSTSGPTHETLYLVLSLPGKDMPFSSGLSAMPGLSRPLPPTLS